MFSPSYRRESGRGYLKDYGSRKHKDFERCPQAQWGDNRIVPGTDTRSACRCESIHRTATRMQGAERRLGAQVHLRGVQMVRVVRLHT